jgi:hypothetical protein
MTTLWCVSPHTSQEVELESIDLIFFKNKREKIFRFGKVRGDTHQGRKNTRRTLRDADSSGFFGIESGIEKIKL